jgi:hypothetical protein
MPTTIYTYAPDGSLTGSQPALQSPKDFPGTCLMPARSTLIAPPAVPSGQQAVFSTSTNKWSLKPIS